MILTPLADDRLSTVLAQFAASLPAGQPRVVFDRIAEGADAARATPKKAVRNHTDAIDLITTFHVGITPGAPQLDVSWNGRVLRSETEAYVLIHEVAHFQLAAPARRALVDFGLGPGPETGDRIRATQAQVLFGLAREREEAMASLLGILWEAELGHPALASLLDQNWLEGAGRLGTAAHFTGILAALETGGFIDGAGRPQMRLRQHADAQTSL
ncbi:MAG TPA: hypothetical protein VEU53_06285 [Stellaceae bacterium]|nr:hypothetical protein [Stellaceae bacterium]